MNILMSSVNLQIQRAISEAVNEEVLPQIQSSLRSVNGQPHQRRWNLPDERPERKSEMNFNHNVRSNSRDLLLRKLERDGEDEEVTHYRVYRRKHGRKAMTIVDSFLEKRADEK